MNYNFIVVNENPSSMPLNYNKHTQTTRKDALQNYTCYKGFSNRKDK